MGLGTGLHYFGSLLILASAVLLIIASITAPTVNSLSFLKVYLNGAVRGGANRVTFGSFGYCVIGQGGGCSGTHIGYNPASLLEGLLNNQNIFGRASEDTVKALTRVFILHPIAAGVAFIAFLFSLKTGFLNIVTTLLSLLAFIITIVCLAIDFAAFEIIRKDINNRGGRASARWGPAIWCVVGAAVGSLFGAVIVFITCCAGRRRSRLENRKVGGY